MKRYISMFCVFALMVTCLFSTGCQNNNISNSDGKLKIVTTIFPEYDWVREVLGDNVNNAEITMLLDNGIDLHNYQPTAQDIMKISECDLFVYVGGESDEWVEDALKQGNNKTRKIINLIELLGDDAKKEVSVEGMQKTEHEHEEHDEHDEDEEHEEHEEDEEHEEHDEDEEHEEHEHNHHEEHVWLSLKNAQIFCKAISDALVELDANNANTYVSNTTKYIEKLKNLDELYESTVDGAEIDTLVFADRFPFRYLVDDYGIKYFAAFSGCSAETEASFETITFLANKVDELALADILILEKADKKIANTVIANTRNKNQKILEINSIQSVTKEDMNNEVTYLSIMEKNLDVLKEALK